MPNEPQTLMPSPPGVRHLGCTKAFLRNLFFGPSQGPQFPPAQLERDIFDGEEFAHTETGRGVESPESRVESRESRVESRESRVQSPESRVQSPGSRVEGRASRGEGNWEDIRGGVSVRQKIDEFSLDESCGFLRIVFDPLSQKIVHIGAKSGIGHVACQQCGKFRTPGP